MRKPKSERRQDIKAKKAFNKNFSKLNELERLKLIGLDPRDAFKMTRDKNVKKKIEKKIIDATKFCENIPEDFFDPIRLNRCWLRNKLLEKSLSNEVIDNLMRFLHKDNNGVYNERYLDELGYGQNDIFDIIFEYECYTIATDDIERISTSEWCNRETAEEYVKSNPNAYAGMPITIYDKDKSEVSFCIVNHNMELNTLGVEKINPIPEDQRKSVIAKFAYLMNSFMEPNFHSHNGTVIENIFNYRLYEQRNEVGEVQVKLSELMEAEIHSNGEVIGNVSKIDILNLIHAYDRLFYKGGE